MKILIIHNTYQHKGGEDSVLENECQLLLRHSNVKKMIFTNDDIQSSFDKLKIGAASIYNISSAKRLKKNIILFKPDIIHVHNFFPIASPSIFYTAHKMNIPIIMTLHNYRLICPNALLFKDNQICEKCINKDFALDGVLHGCYRESKVQTFALALMSYLHKKRGTWKTKISKYIVLTNFAKEKILTSSLGLEESQLTVKSNFVEDFGFDYEKEDYFLFVGRLSIEKGIPLLLEAFKNTNKKLVIIGGGPLKKEVMNALKDNNNITYLGFRDKEFIMQKLKKAKALVFSSIWYEGMPMTILEAFSTATPVLAPNIGGPNEIVINNQNGLIYKVNNVDNLKEKINLIDSDTNLYTNLCIGARKDYELQYSPEKNYELLMNIYKEVINAKT